MKHLIKSKNRVFILCLLAILCIQSCKSTQNDAIDEQQAVQAEVITLQPGDADIYKSFPANLQGKENIQLRPQISGYIDKFFCG
jgi:membrane fusion protein (multidrug efflux system)